MPVLQTGRMKNAGYEPGFFIDQLCSTSTQPMEISAQPMLSGGRMTLVAGGLSDCIRDCVAALTEASG